MDNEQCRKNCTPPPNLEPGAILHEGRFFRNLKRRDPAKRYQWDDDNAPVYGRKIRRDHWKNAKSLGALSVNQVECIHSAACSLLMESAAAGHKHVLEFSLEALSRLIGESLVAQYSPSDGESANPCHFELGGLDSDQAIIMLIGDTLDELEQSLPTVGKKQQMSEQTALEAQAAIAKIGEVWRLHYFPLGEDGEEQAALPPPAATPLLAIQLLQTPPQPAAPVAAADPPPPQPPPPPPAS
jgi:hypothetical protein